MQCYLWDAVLPAHRRLQFSISPSCSLPPLLPPLRGAAVGNVPPFGHRQQLPVIVDSSVAAYARCYAGGGSEGEEILISVPELLRAAAATLADVSRPQGSTEADAARSEQRAAVAAAAAAALPVPYLAGQGEVVIQGVVAHRRKISRLLLFANLVPVEAATPAPAPVPPGAPEEGPGPAAAAPPAPPGTAAYLRRLWRHPETGEPCEVQLIMGKTLERRLGRCVCVGGGGGGGGPRCSRTLHGRAACGRRDAARAPRAASHAAPRMHVLPPRSQVCACLPSRGLTSSTRTPPPCPICSEATAELLRGMRTGQCVRVTGRVQSRLAPSDGAERDRWAVALLGRSAVVPVPRRC